MLLWPGTFSFIERRRRLVVTIDAPHGFFFSINKGRQRIREIPSGMSSRAECTRRTVRWVGAERGGQDGIPLCRALQVPLSPSLLGVHRVGVERSREWPCILVQTLLGSVVRVLFSIRRGAKISMQAPCKAPVLSRGEKPGMRYFFTCGVWTRSAQQRQGARCRLEYCTLVAHPLLSTISDLIHKKQKSSKLHGCCQSTGVGYRAPSFPRLDLNQISRGGW